jgi:hypothetical protein
MVAIGGIAVAFGATAIDQLAGSGPVSTVGPIDDVLRVCGIVCIVAAVLTPIFGHARRLERTPSPAA